MVYDFKAVERFFRSCALSIETSKSMRVKWVEYKDSKVLNAIYTVFFWKGGPGHVELDIATAAELQTAINKSTDQYVQAWLGKLYTLGPSEAMNFVETIAQLKVDAQNSIRQLTSEVSQINSDIINQTETAIRDLARVKLAAGVGVALISGGAGVLMAGGATAITVGGGSIALGGNGLAFAAVGVANSSTLSIIKTYETGKAAKAVAIDFRNAAGQEALGQSSDIAAKALAAKQLSASTVANNAQVTVRRYSDLLGRNSLTPKNAVKYTDRLHTAQQAHQSSSAIAQNAGRGASAMRFVSHALPVVFAAVDIRNSIKEYKETVKGL